MDEEAWLAEAATAADKKVSVVLWMTQVWQPNKIDTTILGVRHLTSAGFLKDSPIVFYVCSELALLVWNRRRGDIHGAVLPLTQVLVTCSA